MRKIYFNLFCIVPNEAEEEGRTLLIEELHALAWDWGPALSSTSVDAAVLALNTWQRTAILSAPKDYPILATLLQEHGDEL